METIISHPFLGNIKYIYSCFIDSSGVGKVSCLSESITKEDTGTKISFGVKQQDQKSFHREMNYYLSYMEFDTNVDKYEYKSTNWPTSGWALLNNTNIDRPKPCVLVGKIPYPISDCPIEFRGLEGTLVSEGLVLKAEIGEVTLPYSRESLHYDDRTTRFVEKRVKEAAQELVTIIDKGLEDCSTFTEAVGYYSNISYRYTKYCNRVWRGYDVSNPNIYLGYSYSSHCKLITLIDPTTKAKKESTIKISSPKTLYVYQDILVPKGLDSKWKLLKSKYNYIYYLSGEGLPKWSDWVDAYKNLKLVNFINLSDIVDELTELHTEAKEKARLERIANAVPGAPKVATTKGNINVRRINSNTACGYGQSIYSIPEEPINKDVLIASNPIIIKIVGYVNASSGLENNIDLAAVVSALGTLGISEIVAVKSSDHSKVDSLRNLSALLATQLDSECMTAFGITLEELVRDVACWEHLVDKVRSVDYHNRKLSTITLSNIAWSLTNYIEIMNIVEETKEFPKLEAFRKGVDLYREKLAMVKKLKLMNKVNQFIIADDVKASSEDTYKWLLLETESMVEKYRLIFTYLLQLGSSSESLLTEEIKTYINYINN